MLEVPRDEEAFAIVDRIYEAAFAAADAGGQSQKGRRTSR